MEPERAEFLEAVKRSIKNRDYLKWTAYALRLLKHFDHEVAIEAEDLVEEVILKVCTGERKWNNRININTFMNLNIRSCFCNYAKKNLKLVYEAEVSDDEEEIRGIRIDQFSGGGTDLPETGFDIEKFAGECLCGLSDEEGIILLELISGKSPKEAAEYLGIKRDAVYYLRRKIKDKIKKLN
jgi:RNA polymerase sigma factor (sigma-70 family)